MIATEDKIALDYGIHPGICWPDYKRVSGVNVSMLTAGKFSALHLHAAMSGLLAGKDSPAMAFGRALHTRLLEPDLFEQRHPAMPDFGNMRTNAAKADRDAWLSELPSGAEPVSRSDAAAIEAVSQSVRSSPVVKMLRARGGCETTVVAELMGMKCKGRLDKLTERPHSVLDIKKVSAGRGGDFEFSRAIVNYDYDAKAAFYCDLVGEITGETPDFYWIVVEDSPPHAVYPYKAGQLTLSAGRNRYRRWLGMYRHGIETGEWPGPDGRVVDLDAPDWHLKQEGVV